jgi:hypothetical protein
VSEAAQSDTTLVTAMYDLASREARPGRRSIGEYLRLARFVLEQPSPLVCYCDPWIAPAVTEARERAGLRAMTRIVPRSLEETRRFGDLSSIEAARTRNPIVNANPSKDTPLYTVLIWSKLGFLTEVCEESPFETGHVAWIDAGVAHVASVAHVDEDRALDLRRPGIRVLALRSWPPGISDDPKAYCRMIRGHLAGGLMSGASERMVGVAALANEWIDRLLRRGVAPTDEQVFTLLADSRPDLFDLYFGDYGQILDNARVLRGGGENLSTQMTDALRRKDWWWAERIGERVGGALDACTFACRAEVLSDILHSWFVAAWQSGDPDRSAATAVAARYAKLVGEDSRFREAYLSRRDSIREAFATLDLPVEIE